MEQTKPILEIKDLSIEYCANKRVVKAVNHLDLCIEKGESVGLVGETGAGKTTTALGVMGLIPNPPGVIRSGEILFEGEDLLKLSAKKMRQIRSKKIAMIFQDPMTSLNPVYTIGRQLGEGLRLHRGYTKEQATARAIELLDLVGIPNPEQRVKDYPHQFSGGMRQRVMIAIALLCDPELLIADEPTTALDVTIQAQILDLLRSINEKLGTSIILITHDLGVVASMVDTVAVMYCGHIVEKADVRTIFQHPLHPYTEGLLRSIPHMDDSQGDLATIEGSVPSIYHMPEGCAFHNRCACCRKICTQKQPPLLTLDGEHTVQCWKYTPQWDEEGGSDHV